MVNTEDTKYAMQLLRAEVPYQAGRKGILQYVHNRQERREGTIFKQLECLRDVTY